MFLLQSDFGALINPVKHDHDRHYQQNMNKSAKHDVGEQGKKPQGTKRYINGPKHIDSFRAIIPRPL
jgi:hypothetical protein